MFNSRVFLRASLALFVIIILSAGSALAQKFGKITDEEKYIGAPADYPEANAVVLFHKGKIEFKFRKIVMHHFKRMKILTEAGIDEVGEQSFSYYNKKTKIKGFKAHTITPDGKKHKVEKDAIFEKTVSNYIEKTFTFPNLEPGSIVEYRYEVHTEYFYYLRPWYFQNNIYTLKSEITTNVALGYEYDVSYGNIPRHCREPKVEKIPDPVTGRSSMSYTWTVENLMPSTDEPYVGCINDYRAFIKFQLMSYRSSDGSFYKYTKEWKDEGDWFDRNWIDGYCNAGGKVKQLAREITAGLTTNREKSEAIFKHVATQYGSTDIYRNRFFVHEKLSQLLEDKSGAVEGKNLLMVKMHDAVDIPCWPVLISTRKNGAFNPKVPGTREFNHLIAVVQLGETEWEFLDASDRHSIYGLLPPKCLTTGGFLIDGMSSSLVDMTMKPLESRRTDVTRMYVGSEGNVICSTDCRFTGYYGSDYAENYDSNTPEDFIEKYYEDRLDVAWDLGDYHCQLDSENNFHVSLNFTSDELVKNLDNNLLVSQVGFAFRDNPFESERRVFPIDFTYPFVYENIVKIYLNDQPVEHSLPEDILNEADGALFKRESYKEGDCIVVKSTLEIYQPLFKPYRYKGIRRLFDQVALAGEDQVAFIMGSAD